MSNNQMFAPDLAGGFFWTSGADKALLLAWCETCNEWLHPSSGNCPVCLSSKVTEKQASGRAVLLAFSENHQKWSDDDTPPYIIAYVSPLEAPNVRLATRIVGAKFSELTIGMDVDVQFRAVANIWIPEFTPVAKGALQHAVERVPLPVVNVRPPASPEKYEHNIAFTGIGKTRIGRNQERTTDELALEACTKAISDAGLDPSEIDGLSCYPGTTGMPGLSSGGVRGLLRAMPLNLNWHSGAAEVPGQIGTVIDAMLAVSSGLCRHVLCFTSFSNRKPAATAGGAQLQGEMAWYLPYGIASPANWIALYAAHYMARFGADRTLLATIAQNSRLHGAQNPEALFRNPLPLDDYLAARPISTPFGLYDCDMPVAGAIAFIVSARDAARDCRHEPVLVEAVGSGLCEHQSWDQGTISHQPNVFGAAAHLWSRSAMQPSDITQAFLYDGFTFNVISWLEALGFCGIGEASDFLGDGQAISATGALPLNSHGGHLACGRTNGYGHLFEAILQMRGNAGARQRPDRGVAIVSTGGGIPASSMILTPS